MIKRVLGAVDLCSVKIDDDHLATSRDRALSQRARANSNDGARRDYQSGGTVSAVLFERKPLCFEKSEEVANLNATKAYRISERDFSAIHRTVRFIKGMEVSRLM